MNQYFFEILSAVVGHGFVGKQGCGLFADAYRDHFGQVRGRQKHHVAPGKIPGCMVNIAAFHHVQ